MVSKVAPQKEKSSVSRLFQEPNCLNPGEEEKKNVRSRQQNVVHLVTISSVL